jgi:hypothetical protein
MCTFTSLSFEINSPTSKKHCNSSAFLILLSRRSGTARKGRRDSIWPLGVFYDLFLLRSTTGASKADMVTATLIAVELHPLLWLSGD